MSFTWEEVCQSLPKLDSRAASVHLEQFPTAKDILCDAGIPERDTKQQADWETLLAIREQVNKALDNARNEKLIGKSVDAQVQVTAADPPYSVLKRYEDQLRYLFIVSAVTLAQASGNGTSGVKIEVRSEEHTSELQSRLHLVCRLLLEKKKKVNTNLYFTHE